MNDSYKINNKANNSVRNANNISFRNTIFYQPIEENTNTKQIIKNLRLSKSEIKNKSKNSKSFKNLVKNSDYNSIITDKNNSNKSTLFVNNNKNYNSTIFYHKTHEKTKNNIFKNHEKDLVNTELYLKTEDNNKKNSNRKLDNNFLKFRPLSTDINYNFKSTKNNKNLNYLSLFNKNTNKSSKKPVKVFDKNLLNSLSKSHLYKNYSQSKIFKPSKPKIINSASNQNLLKSLKDMNLLLRHSYTQESFNSKSNLFNGRDTGKKTNLNNVYKNKESTQINSKPCIKVNVKI